MQRNRNRWYRYDRRATYILIILFSGFFHAAYGQYSDLYTWHHIALDGDIGKKWNIRLTEEIRFDDPFHHLSRYFTQVELNFSPVKSIEITAGYRENRDHQDDGTWEKLHRMHFSVEAGKRVGRLTPSYRLRWQNFPDAWNIDKTDFFYLRHRFSLRWDIPHCKINPTFSAELFHRFNTDKQNELATLRFTLKGSYKFHNRHHILFGLHKQYEYDEKTPENAWIVDTGYRFDLF